MEFSLKTCPIININLLNIFYFYGETFEYIHEFTDKFNKCLKEHSTELPVSMVSLSWKIQLI